MYASFVGLTLVHGVANGPVSGAVADLHSGTHGPPRPLYWQVRRLVAVRNNTNP
jgi:hypothetical protein